MNVGALIARYVESLGVQAAFGVISIHNMPILDALHAGGVVRFVPARGEAGAANMADAYARVTGSLGVVVTSTGTGAGNAAGALIEAHTAGTPLLHLTGQIDSPYLDKDWGFIHENTGQRRMLEGAGKAAFRIDHPERALEVLQEATQLALTPPCGPVSIEIPIDVQGQAVPHAPLSLPATVPRRRVPTAQPQDLQGLIDWARESKRPLLWCGGGARSAGAAVVRLAQLGFGVITSSNGRGVLPENHPLSLGAYHTCPSVEALLTQSDGLLIVGSRLRSNETLGYQLAVPQRRARIDAHAQANSRAYPAPLFVHADAAYTLSALADALERTPPVIDPHWRSQIEAARAAAEVKIRADSGVYVALIDAIDAVTQGRLRWVRDITLANTIWGNRAVCLTDPYAGLHPLGGGIGQGLALGIGAAIADATHGVDRTSVVLIGDGGFMLNVGELACAVQERANVLVLLMNDRGYGVIKNIQDAVYGGRRCYVDLHTPQFALLCASMGAAYRLSRDPQTIEADLRALWAQEGVRVLEVDMQAWGPFNAKPAGPARRT